MGRVFDIPERRLEAMMAIVDNAQVRERRAIFPIEYTVEPRALSKTNEEYMEHAIKLGREAAEEALKRANLTPRDIDLIITVSCTGFMIPSLDAHLIALDARGIDGVPESLAREAFGLAAAKLPIKTRFVQRIAE